MRCQDRWEPKFEKGYERHCAVARLNLVSSEGGVTLRCDTTAQKLCRIRRSRGASLGSGEGLGAAFSRRWSIFPSDPAIFLASSCFQALKAAAPFCPYGPAGRGSRWPRELPGRQPKKIVLVLWWINRAPLLLGSMDFENSNRRRWIPCWMLAHSHGPNRDFVMKAAWINPWRGAVPACGECLYEA